jgi:outer membrane protein assembly factor BamB
MGRRDVGPWMRDVVLDEAPDLPLRGDAPGLALVGRALTRWAVRHPVLALLAAVAIVALFVAAVVVPPWWSVEAERRAVAAPAAAPGFVHDQSAVPVAVWSAAVTWDARVLLAGDTVVAWSRQPDQPEVTGIDVVTGAVRWRTQLPVAVAGTLRRCLASDGTGEGAHRWGVVCLGVGSGAVDTPGELIRRSGAVVVLDALDGTELARREVSGRVGDAAVVGGDVVLLVTDDHALAVVRQEARGGAERWRTTLQAEAPTDLSRLSVDERGGVVLVRGVGLATALAAEDGRVLVDLVDPTPLLDHLALLSDGSIAVGAYGAGERALHLGTTVYGRDGQPRYEVAGTVSEPAITDDTVSRVYAWTTLAGSPISGRLRALDRSTGADRWDALGPASGAVVDAVGIVVLHGTGNVTAVDARTGHELWRRPVSVGTSDHVMTDGRLLLLAHAEPAIGTVLAALRLGDGSTVWETTMPAGVTRVDQLGPTIVGVGPGLVVGLR